jgi:hypothetical protein
MANGYFDTKGLFGTTPEELQRKIFDESQLRRAKEMQYLSQGTTAPGYTYGMLQTLEPLRQQFANTGEDPRVTALREQERMAKDVFAQFPEVKDSNTMRQLGGELMRIGMTEQAGKIFAAAARMDANVSNTEKTVEYYAGILRCDQYAEGTTEYTQCINRARAEMRRDRRRGAEEAGEVKFSEEVGKSFGEKAVNMVNAAESAPEAIRKIETADAEIMAGNANTGIFSPILTTIDKAIAAVAGDDTKAAARVQSTEFLESLLGSDVFPLIKQLGIGARGLDTPAERKFLQSVMTGSVTMNAQTILKMNAIRKNMLIRALNAYNVKLADTDNKQVQTMAKMYGLKPIDVTGYELTDLNSLTVTPEQPKEQPEQKPEEGFKTIDDVTATGFDVDGFVQAVMSGDIDIEKAKKDWKAEFPNVPFPVPSDM